MVFLVCAIPVGAYAYLRSGWLEAIFSGLAFIFLSLELTMVCVCLHASHHKLAQILFEPRHMPGVVALPDVHQILQ